MRKLRKTIGIILLIVLILPVLILARPATRMVPVIHRDPSSIEFVEQRYIPLLEIMDAWATGPSTRTDRVLDAVYIGLFVLAIWLIRYKGRKEKVPAQVPERSRQWKQAPME